MSIESVRLDYPGTTESDVVLDIGGYRGDFAAEMNRKYGCRVIVFEPIPEFFAAVSKRFESNNRVVVVPVGVSGDASEEMMVMKGDSTGVYADGGVAISVRLIGIIEAMSMADVTTVKVVKINCEGCEFAILEKLLSSGGITRIENIQVQFHGVAPNAEARYEYIQHQLPNTHMLTLDAGWVWQNWKRKT